MRIEEINKESKKIKQLKIKSAVCRKIFFTNSGSVLKSELFSEIIYNSDGYILSDLRYGEKEKIRSKNIYTFERNEIIFEKIKYNIDGDEISKEYYKYDSEGRKLEYNKEINRTSAQKEIYEYNSEGKMISNINIGSSGSVENIFENKYDIKGRKTDWYYYQGDGSLNYRYKYDYYIDGKLKNKLKIDTSDNIIYEIKHLYDGEGKLITEEINNIKEDINKKKIYIYKESLLEEESEYEKGELISRKKYEYYKNGKKHIDHIYGKNKKVIFVCEYKYNDAGNEIERCVYFPNGSLKWKYCYEFNENGILIKKEYTFFDGSELKKYVHKYDENGNKLSITKLNNLNFAEESMIFEYEYYD